MSTPEEACLEVLKKHGLVDPEKLEKLIEVLSEMFSGQDALPLERIVQFGRAHGLTAGEAIARLINRGLTEFEREQPRA